MIIEMVGHLGRTLFVDTVQLLPLVQAWAHTLTWQISLNILTLLAIISISLVTIFYSGYKDSLAERIGASILGTVAVSRLKIYSEISPDWLMFQVGLVFRGFAITIRAVRHGHRVWRR